MLRDGLLVFYCAAVGFVAAGIAASLYRLITDEPARFTLLGRGWWATITTFFFCAVTGPAIIADYILKSRKDAHPLVTMVGGFVIAIIWSVCSGILVLDLVLSLRSALA